MQQQQELNTNMLALLDYQGVLARIQGLGEGSALLGKEIEWVGANGAQEKLIPAVLITLMGIASLTMAGVLWKHRAQPAT